MRFRVMYNDKYGYAIRHINSLDIKLTVVNFDDGSSELINSDDLILVRDEKGMYITKNNNYEV